MDAMIGNLREIDIKRLRIFMTIVECGGFIQAQNELNLSASTISGATGRLPTIPTIPHIGIHPVRLASHDCTTTPASATRMGGVVGRQAIPFNGFSNSQK